MNPKDILYEAEQFAKKAHHKQKQITGKPYFEHPKKVAILLKNWEQEDGVIMAGYLHDVVEDCNISLDKIEKLFGKRVTKLVDGMSWIKDKKSGKKDLDATYKKFSKISKKEPAILLIKLADMISNIPNVCEPSHREWIVTKSYPRVMSFYIPFLEAVGLGKQTKVIVKSYNKYVNTPVKSILFKYITQKEINKIRARIKITKL